MSLRLAAAASTSSTFASSSTPATTPVTPHVNPGSSFHVFRATASPPPVLGSGSYSNSRRPSEVPTTPAIRSPSVSNGDRNGDAVNNRANGINVQSKEKEKERTPLITVDIEEAEEEARQRARRKGRTEEEVGAIAQTAARSVYYSSSCHWPCQDTTSGRNILTTHQRFAARLAADHKAVLRPDVETPFVDAQDVVNRLLPYHIFLHPREDLQTIIHPHVPQSSVIKGKRKATEEDILREEIAGM